MTDLPERIWAWAYSDGETGEKIDLGEWYTEDVGLDGDETEYIRADLVPQQGINAKTQRCAECDCEHGGADCTWLMFTPPLEPPK